MWPRNVSECRARTVCRASVCAVLLALPPLLSAATRQAKPEILFTPVGRLEARNFTHLSFALAAFCSQASLGYTLQDIRPIAAEVLCTPGLDGVDLNVPMALHFFHPLPQAPAAAAVTGMPRRVSIVRLTDNGARLFNALQQVYASFEQHPWGVTFSRPDAVPPWPHESVTVSLERDQAILSTSADVVEWLARERPVLSAPPGEEGVFSGAFEAAALAGVLAEFRSRQQNTAGADSILRLVNGLLLLTLPHLSELEFTARSDGLAMTFAATLLPHSSPAAPPAAAGGSAAALDLPAASIIPAHAVYATTDARPSAQGDWLSNVFDGEACGLPSLKRLVHAPATSHTAYLAPSPNSRSLVYASLLATPEPAVQIAFVTQALATARFGARLAYRPQAARTRGDRVIHSFRMVVAEHAANAAPGPASAAAMNADTLPLLLALSAGGLTCELAATDEVLAMTLGPSNALENVLSALESARPSPGQLQARWQTSDFQISPQAEAVSVFYPVRLFHNLVRVLPGSRTELVRRIPTIGDGLAAVRMPPGKEGRTPSLLRITANELNSLQIAFARGQPIIQEMLLMSAIQSLMARQQLAGKPEPSVPRPVAPADGRKETTTDH